MWPEWSNERSGTSLTSCDWRLEGLEGFESAVDIISRYLGFK